MAEGNTDDELEQYGDANTSAEIAEDMANMPDLALGKIAGISDVMKDLHCGGAREANHETDGRCKVYNAALDEFEQRSNKSPPSR